MAGQALSARSSIPESQYKEKKIVYCAPANKSKNTRARALMRNPSYLTLRKGMDLRMDSGGRDEDEDAL